MNNIIIAGAAPDTGNLGVSALCHSIVTGLRKFRPNTEIDVLFHGNGFKPNAYTIDHNQNCNLLGAKFTRRIYAQSSFPQIKALLRAKIPLNQTVKRFRSAKAMLDISGGDSFTDMYGTHRYTTITAAKLIALENNIPLVLLPQTYGPFKDPKILASAKEIVKKTEFSFARDKNSFDFLKNMLGEDFDQNKHRLGVDVAFLLSPQPYPVPKEFANETIFGLNISGLIYNDPVAAKFKYGIDIDYPKVLKEIVQNILDHSDGKILLIPHVTTKPGHFEDDQTASLKFMDSLSQKYKTRVSCLLGTPNQCEIKHVISKTAWFCGTRMHATIASLSSSVPTATIAYSGKAYGVFESAGQEEWVFDSRSLDEDSIISGVLKSWREREEIRTDLSNKIEKVKKQALEQMAAISHCF